MIVFTCCLITGNIKSFFSLCRSPSLKNLVHLPTRKNLQEKTEDSQFQDDNDHSLGKSCSLIKRTMSCPTKTLDTLQG